MTQADRIKLADEIDNFPLEGMDISTQSSMALNGLLGRAADALRASPPEAEGPSPLELFAMEVIDNSREYMGDVDGGWIQDRAAALGILVETPVTEACGEECQCAEFGFPSECYRYSAAVQAKRLSRSEGSK
jgi:hypothetical protein